MVVVLRVGKKIILESQDGEEIFISKFSFFLLIFLFSFSFLPDFEESTKEEVIRERKGWVNDPGPGAAHNKSRGV